MFESFREIFSCAAAPHALKCPMPEMRSAGVARTQAIDYSGPQPHAEHRKVLLGKTSSGAADDGTKRKDFESFSQNRSYEFAVLPTPQDITGELR